MAGTPFAVIDFNGKKLKFRLSLQSLCEIQVAMGDRWKGMGDFLKGMDDDFLKMRLFLWAGIHPDAPEITEEDVARLLSATELAGAVAATKPHVDYVNSEPPPGERKNAEGTATPPGTPPAPESGIGTEPSASPVKPD